MPFEGEREGKAIGHFLLSKLLSLTLSFKYSCNIDRVDKKRDKIERKILDSQERAFWDVHRPVVSDGGAALPVSRATDKYQPLWSIGVAWKQVFSVGLRVGACLPFCSIWPFYHSATEDCNCVYTPFGVCSE